MGENDSEEGSSYQFTMFPTGRRLLTGAALLRQQKAEGLIRYVRTETMVSELERRGWKFLITDHGETALVAPTQR